MVIRCPTDTDHSYSVPIMLVGNKLDLEDDRQVSQAEGNAMAAHMKASFVEIRSVFVQDRCYVM